MTATATAANGIVGVWTTRPAAAPPAGFQASPDAGADGLVRWWTGARTTAVVHRDRARGAAIHLWGRPVHPEIDASAIAAWVLATVLDGEASSLRALLGPFVAVVDEAPARRVHFVTDPLGIRPLFLHRTRDRVAFASEAWALREFTAASGGIDYAAVASWIVFGFNATDGSLFTDIARLAPGAITTIEETDGGRRERVARYATLAAADLTTEADTLAATIHDHVERAVRALLRDVASITVPLSGGYDSRHLLATARTLMEPDRIRCVHVAFDREEAGLAAAIAERAGVGLDTIDALASPLDASADVFGWTADGFPISRFGTDAVARLCPGPPNLNGFMGDSLVAGSKDRIDGRLEPEWGSDIAGALHRFHAIGRLDVFRPEFRARIDARARASIEAAIARGRAMGKVFAWVDFHLRQRLYIANNFLQHLDVAEALVPFYQWPLLDLKVRHAYGQFDASLHARLLDRFCPLFAGLPHEGDLPRRSAEPPRISRHTRRWSVRLAAELARRDRLDAVRRSWCLPRVVAAGAGHVWSEDVVVMLERLARLERRLAAAGVDFDWWSV